LAHLDKIVVPVQVRLSASDQFTVASALQDARRAVKRARDAADEANRILARIEADLDPFYARLEELGIRLEVDA
jgi:hypothetical protein